MHIISKYTQSGNVKRYESTLGPSFDTNTIGATITRTNSGDNTYEYKVTASGYDISTSGTKVVVKYGPSSAEAKKTFYFEKTYFFILIYFYNATGEVNGNTWTTGTMNVCPNYLSFGLIKMDIYILN